MTKKPRKPLETRPIGRLSKDRHSYDEDPDTGRCGACQMPESNRLHKPADPADLPQPTDEQRAADRARLGERDD